MIIQVSKSGLSGEIKIPPSKSITQRVYAGALLRKGKTLVLNNGVSNDETAALAVIQKFGVKISDSQEGLLIDSSEFITPPDSINCGESGLALRMFTPIVALADKEIEINGTGSLLKRPIDFFVNILPKLDVKVSASSNYPPFKVRGPLITRDIEIDGSVTSQFLSGLLFAYSANSDQAGKIKVRRLNSKPYIDLTIDIIEKFNLANISNDSYSEFTFSGTGNRIDSEEHLVFKNESDWSSGAFILVAGAVAGELKLKGLNLSSIQSDRKILEALEMAGANIRSEGDSLSIKKTKLKSFHFNATDCPDLFPPLAALAVFCEGKSSISGVDRLKYKESDRALSIFEEFGKLGIPVSIEDNAMFITGTKKIKANKVSSRNDHRIAMALTVIGMNSSEPVYIDDAEAINKSYPDFFKHLILCGANIKQYLPEGIN